MQKRMNLTKTIRKLPINEDGQRAGYYVHDDLSSVDIKYDEPTVGAINNNTSQTCAILQYHFAGHMERRKCLVHPTVSQGIATLLQASVYSMLSM